MVDLIRDFDWSATPLGPIEDWSGTLRSTVSFMIQAPLPLALLWGEQGILIYNEAYARFAADRHPGILGRPVAEAWPEAAAFIGEVLRRCRDGGHLSYAEQPFMLKRGGTVEQIWLDLHFSPVRNRRNEVVGILEVLLDTTERLQLERQRQSADRALRDSEAQLQALTAALPQLIWTADATGRYDYFNERWREFTGLQAETTDVAAWLGVVHPEDREVADLSWRHAVETGQGYQTEYRLRRADGTWRWFLRRALPVRDEVTGEVIRWLGTCTDIEHTVRARDMLRQSAIDLEARVRERTRELEAEQRERQRAETQLRQAQKMEALGNLTGGVAHDFNNLLQVIHGNLELLARDLSGQPEAARRVEHALGAVDRGARLAAQLLAFARRQPLQPRVVNIARFLHGLDDMLSRSLGEQVEIETMIASGLWNTLVDPGQVENALLNLAINARDAMEGHGRLTIEASNVTLDAAYARMHPEAEPGEYVMLAVTDTGSGMSAEVMEKVFEPFFTTKPEGKGTGLGLSMVYGFVRQSGGHVRIESEPGHGTTIRLYLPRCERAEERDDRRGGGPALGGKETVLVVEDDLAVREVVVDTLTSLGYTVLRARDAEGAMAIIESGMTVDLLFTDVVMPGPMRSTELVERARSMQPRMAVLFTSGYAENTIVHGGRVDAGVELLTKPYSQKALARKLRHVLANQAQRNAALPPAAPPALAAPAMRSVLLVEDDPLIREGTRDLLAKAGHRVRMAADAQGALALLEREPCDVLITDIGLPGMTGAELAARVHAMVPDIALVFASGYHHAPDLPEALARRAVMLHKPYDSAQLLNCLERAVLLSGG
ncbi:response regulator [Pseudoroseomonas ludipueritiae]|nr:response regulator [Pseudoroseomonas ludipueritiae]